MGDLHFHAFHSVELERSVTRAALGLWKLRHANYSCDFRIWRGQNLLEQGSRLVAGVALQNISEVVVLDWVQGDSDIVQILRVLELLRLVLMP